MTFDVCTEHLQEGAYIVSLAGEIDVYNAPEVEQELQDVIGRGGRRLVVDLSRTTFIDSMALGVLVGTLKYLRTVDGRLALVCGSADVSRFFEIAGLDRFFTIRPTRAEALAALDE